MNILLADLPHATAAQRERMDMAEALHIGTAAHCSDDVLCETISNGGYVWANISPADVRLNRKYRGPCAQCLEAKLKNKSMPSSMTPPADAIGAKVHGDISRFHARTPGGNIVSIRMLDEYAGYQSDAVAKSGSAKDIYDAIVTHLAKTYNKYGHKVNVMLFDADPVLEAVIPLLALIGIHMKLVTPPI